MDARRSQAESAPDGLVGDWVSMDDVLALDLFKATKRAFRTKLAANFSPRPETKEPAIKAAVRRTYGAGETICEAGAYGSTAFLLVEGTATSFVPERRVPASIPGRTRGSLGALKNLFRRRGHSPRAADPGESDVGEISAYATLAPARAPAPVTLRPGAVFGVDTCVNFYPRARTVRAEEPCVVIEMLRSVLDTLRDFGAAGSELVAAYRDDAIRQELYGCALFAELGDAELERLVSRATLLTPASPEVRERVIYAEGERGDTVYLVRGGSIALSQRRAGGDEVLSYLGRGSVFGLEPLLEDAAAPPGLLLRCTSHPDLGALAIDRPLTIGRGEGCEMRVPGDDRAVGRRHCRLEERDGALYVVDLESANFTLVNDERVQEAKLRPGDRITVVQYVFEIGVAADAAAAAAVRRATAAGLDEFEVVVVPATDLRALAPGRARVADTLGPPAFGSALRAGREPERAILEQVVGLNLYNSQNTLLIDLERCTRCDECVRACATAHDGVARFTRDGPRFGKYLVTMACRSCTDPKCMVGCPVGSIRRRGSLEIHIEDWCIGCQHCAEQCPFGNINMVELAEKPDLAPPVTPDVKLRATVCDLCAGYDGPNCVYACPHDAAIRVNPSAFLSGADQA